MYYIVLHVTLLVIMFFIFGCMIGYGFRYWWEKQREASRQAAFMSPSTSSSSGEGLNKPTISKTKTSAQKEITKENSGPSEKEKKSVAKKTIKTLTKDTEKKSSQLVSQDLEQSVEISPNNSSPNNSSPSDNKAPSQDNKADSVGARPSGLAAPREGKADDLKKIKGIGKQNEKKLADLGIFHFEQIANWTDQEVAWVGTFLAFPGRIEREDWISQAKELANRKID